MSSNRNPLSAFVLLDCFLTQIEFQKVEHTWRAPQLQLVAVPVLRRLHQHFSPFLACAETGLSVTDAMGLWLERRRRKVHDLTCTIDSRKMCFSSFMYVCVCVCVLMKVCFPYSSVASAVTHYIICQLHFLADTLCPVMKVSVTVWLKTLIFLPAVLPDVRFYYNNNSTG